MFSVYAKAEEYLPETISSSFPPFSDQKFVPFSSLVSLVGSSTLHVQLINSLEHELFLTGHNLNSPRAKTILFNPIELTFQLGNFEPFFCSVCLYDINLKKRISENHYFQVNPDSTLEALVSPEIIPQNKRAIFTVSHPHSEVYMILRIEKILQGDIEEVCEPYCRTDIVCFPSLSLSQSSL